jgi:serine/threonine protein kinase
MVKLLGKGSYGEVKLAIDKLTLKKYALKIYSKKTLEDPKKKSNIENEITILKQLDNINIMKLYEVIKTDKFQYLIMEYIDGISLLDIIKKEKNHYLEEKRALKIFKQILQAIDYCQSKNICHRDIKLENILTIKEDIVKLIDFGFAVITNKETYQTLLCGSPSYMAPEIVKREKYIAQYSDIWSLGVLLYSMLYGRFPFKGKTQKELFENIKKCQVEFPDDIKVNEKIISLMKKIFVVTPVQRPSLSEILEDISRIDA